MVSSHRHSFIAVKMEKDISENGLRISVMKEDHRSRL